MVKHAHTINTRVLKKDASIHQQKHTDHTYS